MRRFDGQKGMTLIELLIALAITSVIMGALLGVIVTVMRVSGRGNGEAEALRDIRSTAFWIGNDAQMANAAVLTGGAPSDNVTLSWNDASGTAHTVNYALYDSRLLRHSDGVRTVIAYHVQDIEFTVNSDILAYTVTATPEGMWDVSRTLTGQVTMRAVP